MNARKKLTLKIAAGLLVFLVVCTILSQTIYRMLLPVVETVEIGEGNLSTWIEADGKPDFLDQKEILAGTDWKVTEVLVKKGAIVEEGTPLFRVDTREAGVALEQSELAVLKLRNQLEANSVTAAERDELNLQIQIAEEELAAYRDGLPLSNDIEELRLKLAVIRLENQADVDEQALKLAKDELASYQRRGAGLDTSELLSLDKKIAGLRKSLESSSLSDEKRKELEGKLQTAEDEREALISGYGDYDPLYEEGLKQEVLKAEQNLKGNASERDRSVLELEKEIAQEELALYQQKQKSSASLSAKRLELAVLQLKNQLAGSSKTAAEQQELEKQIEIAEQELAIQRENWPEDGLVLAPASGTVSVLAARKGETLPAGKTAAAISTQESQPCLRWELSYEAGSEYRDAATATVSLPSNKGRIVGQGEALSVTITDRVLDEETNTWTFTAPVEEGEIPVDTTSLRVRLTKTGESYEHVVPLSCIRQDAYGNNTVLAVKTRQGIFSEEDYLVELRVELLDKNSMNAAVDSSEFEYGMRLVHYSSKPVSAGSVVSVGTVEK